MLSIVLYSAHVFKENTEWKMEGLLLELLQHKFHQDGKLTYLPANQGSLEL